MTREAVAQLFDSLLAQHELNFVSRELAVAVSLFEIEKILVEWIGTPETCVCREHGHLVLDQECAGCALATARMRELFNRPRLFGLTEAEVK